MIAMIVTSLQLPSSRGRSEVCRRQRAPPPPPLRRPPRCCAATPIGSIEVKIREASGGAELRAAAYLRAQTFYQVPEDRSEFARRAYIRLKADAQWEEMMERSAAGDRADPGRVVTTLIATALAAPGGDGGPDLLAQLSDRSSALPRREGGPVEVVVGTLDLNRGVNLPAEELIGRRPTGGDASQRRAYLSNVCVLPAARRQGIAQALIQDAAARAVTAGVGSLYVHVVADNEPANRLYGAQGFGIEQEESEGTARMLNRPRRLLLHRCLDALGPS